VKGREGEVGGGDGEREGRKQARTDVVLLLSSSFLGTESLEEDSLKRVLHIDDRSPPECPKKGQICFSDKIDSKEEEEEKFEPT